MKLWSALCCAWWFLHTVQSVSFENYLKKNAGVIESELIKSLGESGLEEAIQKEKYLEDMLHNQFKDKEENIPYPFGKRTPQAETVTRGEFDSRLLAIGNHWYCGPYTMHYTNSQCSQVGLHYSRDYPPNGISVEQCQAKCDDHYSCNAFNWSHKRHLGCVLRDCGPEAVPNPFPMPQGCNVDWVSFSRYKPPQIPQCRKTSGSYDTPGMYCGP